MRFTRTLVLLLLLAGLYSPAAKAQSLSPGEWRTYTSMKSIRDVTVAPDGSSAWAVTSGGAFRIRVNVASDEVLALRTTNGLKENDLSAVAVDASGRVYLGGRNGTLSIYEPETGKVTNLADISSTTYSNRSIKALAVYSDRLYISTGFGLSVYSIGSPGFFLTTVNRFASLNPQDSVIQTVESNDYVFALLQTGLVYANRNSILNNYQNWQLDTLSGAGTALADWKGRVFVGTTDGLWRVSDDRRSMQSIALKGTSILSIAHTSDSLYVLDASGTLSVTGDGSVFVQRSIGASINDQITSFDVHGSDIVLGTSRNGLAVIAATLRTGIFPNGPIDNGIYDLSFGSDGTLYTVSGGVGVSTFDPATEQWSNFPSGANGLPAFNYRRVLYDSVRSVAWYSTFGSGLVRGKGVANGQPEWKQYGVSNGIAPFDQGTFIVTGSGIIDRQGRFVITSWAQSGQGISRTTDGEVFEPIAIAESTPEGLPFGAVTQDLDNTYWVGTEPHNSPRSTGMYWRTTEGRGFVPGGGSLQLADPAISAVLTDQDDEVWVGHEKGVDIIANPAAVTYQSTPKLAIRSVKLLDQQVVHCMTTDGVGNKWIGTDNGVFIVSPDGADSVGRFTKENSPLIDNGILAIAIDAKRGEAYVSTVNGVNRFSTIFRSGNPDYSAIRVYPNPVVQTGEESPTVFIDGLVSGSTIKILTLSGKMVATVNGSSLGSTVQWNGRDDAGRALPSGMYLISATSPQSGENGAAKLVIVRK